MVGTSKCGQALCTLVAAEVLDIVAGNDPALGVADNVEAFEARSGTNALQFLGDGCGELGDGPGVEPPQEAAQVKTEHAVSVVSKTVLHDLPHVSSLEESMQQQDGLVELSKVVPTNDSITAEVDPPDASELTSNDARQAQR